MSVEDLVAAFLDRREAEPSLTPEAFAADLGALRPAVLAAITRALEVEGALSDAAPAVPREIAGFRILREIGRGGMGAVFEAEKDGARVALKLLHPACVSAPSAMQRFVREANALARVQQANVVALREHGCEHGQPYLAMEYVDGRPLPSAAEGLDVRRAAELVRDLSLAVAALHEAGILHRDIKPQNVILRSDGTPVLVDLGLASLAGDDTLTASGALLGTPRYMAPEQARGEEIDERSDVFALGLILYELVCGRPARSEGSRERVLGEVARSDVPAPRRAARGLDRRLDRILRSALAWKRERRMPTARALAEDLTRYLAGAPVEARPPGLLARAIDAPRRAPRAVALVSLASVVALLLGWIAWANLGPASRAGARATAAHVDAALLAWFQGAGVAARIELERAERAGFGGDELRIASALVHGDATNAPEGTRAALEAWLRGDFAAAAAQTEPRASARTSALAAQVLHVEALRRSGNLAAALETGHAAHARAPESAAVASVLASALAESGDAAGAIDVAREAALLQPRSGPARAQLARLLAESGETAEAVANALSAAELFQSEGIAYEVELARLLAGTPDLREVKAELARVAELRRDHALAWFALGWLHDGDHELARAEQAYRRACESDPALLRARTNLAHLYAGAQRGACRACDEAYAAIPAMFAPERSIDELASVLRADRGASDWAMGRVVQTALDLAERSPSAGAPRRLLTELEALVRDPTLAPAARSRVDEAVSRLRRAQ